MQILAVLFKIRKPAVLHFSNTFIFIFLYISNVIWKKNNFKFKSFTLLTQLNLKYWTQIRSFS